MKLIKIIRKNFFFLFSLLLCFLFANLGREPFYGKIKFIFVNNYFFLKQWNTILNNNIFETPLFKNNKINSDPITEYTLYGSFGIEVPQYYRHTIRSIPDYVAYLDKFPRDSQCLINLKGFPETWVPVVTGHWDPIISDTARFYEMNGYRGKKLNIYIQNFLKDKCLVFADKEIPWELGENFRFHSPNLNFTNQQEDVHILQFKTNADLPPYNILIDTGMIAQTKEKLLDYLAINEIFRIDEIFITHPHKDHYEGLYELIKFGIPIRKIWMNLPKKENCDKEIPWGCDFKDILKLRDLIKEKKIELKEALHLNPEEPLQVYSDLHNFLSVIYASPPVHPKLGEMDINDLSIMLKLTTNGNTYLFTGDLNNPLSNLLKNDSSFKSDILKVPHHGTEGVASNDFFDIVQAKIAIVPSPKHLWCSERSSRIRNYFKDKKTKIYISGFHGDILIRHFENGQFYPKTEYNPERICDEIVFYSFWERFKGKLSIH